MDTGYIFKDTQYFIVKDTTAGSPTRDVIWGGCYDFGGYKDAEGGNYIKDIDELV